MVKLDLGCGKRKQEGFIGVDSIKFDGVDEVVDLTQKWPWENDSVDEVHCSHTLEHFTNPQRTHFANELYRVLKKGAKATIVTPHWSNDCAYGDPTHQWPPISGWTFMYWNKDWRQIQAPHTDKENNPEGLDCDFDWVIGGSWEQWLQTRNMEFKMFAMSKYINSQRDLIVTLTKRT